MTCLFWYVLLNVADVAQQILSTTEPLSPLPPDLPAAVRPAYTCATWPGISNPLDGQSGSIAATRILQRQRRRRRVSAMAPYPIHRNARYRSSGRMVQRYRRRAQGSRHCPPQSTLHPYPPPAPIRRAPRCRLGQCRDTGKDRRRARPRHYAMFGSGDRHCPKG